jgi:hypothetical protein
MKGVLSAELAGVVLTLKSMGGLPLPGEPTLPPPQADKIRPNSKTPTRIHSPELKKNNRPPTSAGARRIAKQMGQGELFQATKTVERSNGSASDLLLTYVSFKTIVMLTP